MLQLSQVETRNGIELKIEKETRNVFDRGFDRGNDDMNSYFIISFDRVSYIKSNSVLIFMRSFDWLFVSILVSVFLAHLHEKII